MRRTTASADKLRDHAGSLEPTGRNRIFSIMPRYYFDVHHDGARLDFEGEELPDHRAAWEEATVSAGQLLKSLDGRLRPGHDWKMEVCDEFRRSVFAIQISAKKPKSE